MKYIKTFEGFINEGYLFENYDTVSIIKEGIKINYSRVIN